MFSKVLLVIAFLSFGECIFPEFDDQLHYNILWNGELKEQGDKASEVEKVIVTTDENERYQCLVPQLKGPEEVSIDDSNGPSAEVLLADTLLGKSQKCSFRLEPYWTYEICHGQKVVQFHEEKDGEGVTRKSEFTLGKLTKAEVREILSKVKPISATDGGTKGKGTLKNVDVKNQVPTRRIDNKDTPYFSVEMGNGTPCDLNNGVPRKTTVLYICHPGANNEVVNIKEVTTCEYEALVLTPMLCGNPAYVVKNKEVQSIQCHAMPGSPRTPKKLAEYAPQSRQSRPITKTEEKPVVPKEASAKNHHGSAQFKPQDKAINMKFLKGEYCLHGEKGTSQDVDVKNQGSGWWKYEFCNGKHIVQYHIYVTFHRKKDPNGKRTTIIVGRWDKKLHLDHIKKKKLVAKAKNHVSQYYFGGNTCDLTGKPRSAHIKLICKEGEGQPLSIYMTEDKPCEYTVGVESPILCPYVKGSGDDGIFIE